MSKLTAQAQVIAAEARLAAAMVELVLSAIHECGLVVVHPRDTETIGAIADQIDGARSDNLNPGETALLVLDALTDGESGAVSGNDLGEVA